VSRRRKTLLRAIGSPSGNTPTLVGSQSRGYNDRRDLSRIGDAPGGNRFLIIAVASYRDIVPDISIDWLWHAKFMEAGNVVPTRVAR